MPAPEEAFPERVPTGHSLSLILFSSSVFRLICPITLAALACVGAARARVFVRADAEFEGDPTRPAPVPLTGVALEHPAIGRVRASRAPADSALARMPTIA
jgi:hypothetical protein